MNIFNKWRRLIATPREGGRLNMRVPHIGGHRRKVDSVEAALARAGFQILDTTSDRQLDGDEGWGAAEND